MLRQFEASQTFFFSVVERLVTLNSTHPPPTCMWTKHVHKFNLKWGTSGLLSRSHFYLLRPQVSGNSWPIAGGWRSRWVIYLHFASCCSPPVCWLLTEFMDIFVFLAVPSECAAANPVMDWTGRGAEMRGGRNDHLGPAVWPKTVRRRDGHHR